MFSDAKIDAPTKYGSGIILFCPIEWNYARVFAGLCDWLAGGLLRAGVLSADYDFKAHKKLVPMQPEDVKLMLPR